ncbi:uncharacterized protein YbjT (DUF2867 family) [Lewinella marina]|uniref:Nucleoside-diphosphate sugar epimerase n=1 Tax=Neolewinella marina TaxID=438751 RepID=A0A2G0CB79_9BACT|nr:NmrA/HSCARG family protein [Neolewinella marina]NJB87742.1 uncharacterized protein YbjT (DUF2867 family) [Neolewinella marina]PHK97215.1 nucleoside-diphosphate sugar epimerase [Neolewinella marina]
MESRTIAVIGATGAQGKGVVHALVREGSFTVRAITRKPDDYGGKADAVVHGDLTDPDSLTHAFQDAYGAFVVTNFWEGADELAQGKQAVQAAREAGVKHFVWSTLPNVEEISSGKFEVPHFTGKAKVDGYVRRAGFPYYSFVQAPFYFQNLSGMLGPQAQADGSTGWTLPIDPAKEVIHMGDVNDLGKVVAGAFLHPDKVGKGSYLSLAAGAYSFNDVLEAYQANGKEYTFNRVPGEQFSTFFEGAGEIEQMLAYFEAYTYLGPDSENSLQSAREVATGKFKSLSEWVKQNVG